MAQPQNNLYKLERHQPQPNRKDNYVDETQLNLKDIEVDETHPNRKALEWLRTQFYEKRWEEQKNKEKIAQKPKNGKPIIVINYLNYSEHFIRTMVDEVLTKYDFGDDSSIFVAVPSVNDDAEKSSHGQNSTIGIEMSTNPIKWNNKVHVQEQVANHGVKVSSKGKKFTMEGLPAEILSSQKQKTSSDHKHLKDEAKKATTNKLCQFNTPDGIVRRLEHSCNVITDTTADRPCCCSLKTTHNSDYSPNEKYVADVLSKLFPPLVAKHGLTGDKCHIPLLEKNSQESVEPVTAPQAPCHIQPCRYPRAQHHRAQNQYHNNSAPEHDNPHLTPHPVKLFNNLHHATVPDQYHTNSTPQYFIPYVASRPDKPYPDLKHATVPAQYPPHQPTSQLVNPCLTQPCFNPHPAKTYPDPHTNMPSPNTHLAKPRPDPHSAKPRKKKNTFVAQETTNLLQMQTCQCTPEMMLELLKLAVKGGKIEDMQSIGCVKRAEASKLSGQKPTQFTKLAPCNEPDLPICSAWKSKENEEWCPCGRPSAGRQIDMGETKQKQVILKEPRYISTVGTSTEERRGDEEKRVEEYKPKWNKTKCDCPKDNPEPESQLENKPEPEFEDLTFACNFQQVESFEETMKQMLETERNSEFNLNQKKRASELAYTAEDAIRYYAMMHPAPFQRIMGEQQAKLNGKTIERRPATTAAKEAPAEEEGPFQGLKFKIGAKGSGTKGLAGICCFDLLQESFTTW